MAQAAMNAVSNDLGFNFAVLTVLPLVLLFNVVYAFLIT